MKKMIVWAMAALLMIPVSCTKGGGETKPMDDPKTKDLAQVIKFKSPVTVGALDINTIELTEANRYIVKYDATKASPSKVMFGNFSYSNGEFSLHGFGSIKIDGNTVSIKTETAGGSPAQGEATITPTTTSDTGHSNLSRNWKIGKIILGVSGGPFGQAGVEKLFNNGLDMKEIGAWFNTYVTLSQEDLATISKYTVKEISFTGAGSMAVAFSQADPIVGSYRLNNTGLAFDFNPQDIPFISSGMFSGNISFGANSCKVTAEATVVHESKTYKASLEMDMTPVQ